MGAPTGFMPTRLRLVLALDHHGVLVGDKEPIEKIGLNWRGNVQLSGSTRSRDGGIDRCLKKAGLDLLSQEDAAQQRPTFISFRRCPNVLGVSCFFQQSGARS